MKSRLLMLFTAGVIALQCVCVARAQQSQEEILVTSQVLPLLSMGEVDKLEKMGSDLLTSKQRLPDGRWQLDAFNGAFETFMMGGRQFDLLKTIFEKWAKAYPQSKIAPVAHANVLFAHAFDIRGGKVANEVWKEDWELFNQYLEQALDILEKSRPQATGNPRWYSVSVELKGALSYPKAAVLEVAREALTTDPTDFVTAQRALNFLLPKWGGSAEMARTWIDEAAKLSKTTEGDAFYAKLYWNITGSKHDADVLGKNFDWPRMKKATDDLVQRYPTTEHKVKALVTACKFHDAAEVTRRYEVIAKAEGPKMAPTIDPAVYCRWPTTAAGQPGVVNPDMLPDSYSPKKTRQN